MSAAAAKHQPFGAQLGRCPACRRVIVWAFTLEGVRVPVDLTPLPAGQRYGCGYAVVELFVEYFPSGDPVDGVQRVRRRPLDRAIDSPAWLLHWTSCT